MRLTLRTLLAYLDGNLEPDDAEDIGRKIEESEFPQKLVQLIRECTRRPRLGAPPLSGRGLGADPNTVAEYLEYRLGDERVPEFERICLDSEIHLAEVASCHQILTLVLGEPAEIDPHSRQRMYALAAQADAPPLQTDSIHQAVSAPVPGSTAPGSTAAGSMAAAAHAVSPPPGAEAHAGAPPVVRRPKPEVPEYLRENRWRVWPLIGMVLVAATLTFAGLFFFGPQPIREQMTALMSTPAAAPEQAADSATEPANATSPEGTPPDGVAGEVPAADAGTPPVEPMPPVAGATEPAPAAATPDAATPDAATPVTPDAAEPAPLEPGATPAPEGEPAIETEPATAPAGDATLSRPSTAMPEEGDPATAPVPPEPGAADASARPAAPMPLTTARPAAPTTPDGEMPAEPQPLPGAGVPSNEPADAPAAESPRRLPAEGFGRYLSGADVLLNFDPASGDWVRLPSQAPLNKGQRLLSLPLFHPTITLSSNFTVQADGPADFELVGWNDAGAPILAVQYGRMLMSTVGKAGNAMRLQIDGQEPLVTFVDPESTLAIEVRRDLPPGKNPESALAPLAATIYAVSGLIRVTKADGTPVELQAPAILSLTGNAEPQPGASQFPAWLNHDQSDGNNRAAGEIRDYVVPDKPLTLQLRELLDPQNKLFKKREVRTLAIRSLANLGEFEPSITALNDAELRQYWHEVRRELQTAVARSPETAARVREAFLKQRGETDGKALYRMLWGYTPSDLQTGSDRDLVDALGRDDALDFRVLGILALEDVHGAKHGYQPDDTPFKRKTSLSNWKNRIGKLVPRTGGAAAKSRPAAPPAD